MATRRTRRNAAISEIRIYFEGNKTLKPGFEQFFSTLREAASAAHIDLRLVAAKSGPEDYLKATRTHLNSWNILLKDSEGQMPQDRSALCEQHGIPRGHVDNVFWMVELMESWFLADCAGLEDYYGQHFSSKAIGKTADVEKVSKLDVLRRLKHATKNTTKGEYDKVAHAPRLLERLNTDKVQAHAPHCRQLFAAISEKLH